MTRRLLTKDETQAVARTMQRNGRPYTFGPFQRGHEVIYRGVRYRVLDAVADDDAPDGVLLDIVRGRPDERMLIQTGIETTEVQSAE